MSIINEAIKKAKKESEQKSNQITTNLPKEEKAAYFHNINPRVYKRDKKKPFFVYAVLIILLCVVGSLVYIYLYPPSDLLIEPETAKLEIAIQPEVMPQPIEQPVEPEIKLADNIQLNGIVYGLDDKWAIIDNKIAREGDLLPSGKLVLIAENLVKIKRDSGEEIVLNLQ